MTAIVVNTTDTFEEWRVKINDIAVVADTAAGGGPTTIDLTGLTSVETGAQQTSVVIALQEAYRLAFSLSMAMS